MVNMNNLLNGKDSRWLQLEVCREFQRNKCTRPDTECKFAHPPANVEVQNGRVTACYDSIKVTNRCIIEFSYSRVTSAFKRIGIVGPLPFGVRPINSAVSLIRHLSGNRGTSAQGAGGGVNGFYRRSTSVRGTRFNVATYFRSPLDTEIYLNERDCVASAFIRIYFIFILMSQR